MKSAGINCLEAIYPDELPPCDMTFYLPDVRPLMEVSGLQNKRRDQTVLERPCSGVLSSLLTLLFSEGQSTQRADYEASGGQGGLQVPPESSAAE